MLLVTPLKALFVETTEVSPFFNEMPSEGMKVSTNFVNFAKKIYLIPILVLFRLI